MSDDGGAFWRRGCARWTLKTACYAGPACRIVASTSEPDVAYAYNSEYVIKTTDGGKTWTDMTSYNPDPEKKDHWRGRGWNGWCSRNVVFNPYRKGQSTVQAMDAQDSVILAGYQANPYPYIAASRFLVCPSFTEGLPVVGMEALCLGIPVVAAVPSVGELFGGEDCGLITENDNSSLRDGMRRMLTDQEFYAANKAGAERRSGFFSGRRMAQELEEMFLQMMQEK